MHKLNQTYIKQTTETRLYSCSVPIIGITGSIATGKSSVTDILRSKGFGVIDADALIKMIYAQKKTKSFLKDTLSLDVIEEDHINFKKLRSLFFKNSGVKEKLETFLFERLPEAFHQAFSELNHHSFVFYDVPLLFEKKLEEKLDATCVVYCSPETQLKRLILRDDISQELAQKMIETQMSINAKKALTELIIDNSFSKSALAQEVDQFLSKLIS